MKLTKAQHATLQAILAQFEAAKDELVSGLEALRDEWQEQFDQKSEKWQEGEAGETAKERIDTVEEMIKDLENIELPDLDSLK